MHSYVNMVGNVCVILFECWLYHPVRCRTLPLCFSLDEFETRRAFSKPVSPSPNGVLSLSLFPSVSVFRSVGRWKDADVPPISSPGILPTPWFFFFFFPVDAFFCAGVGLTLTMYSVRWFALHRLFPDPTPAFRGWFGWICAVHLNGGSCSDEAPPRPG